MALKQHIFTSVVCLRVSLCRTDVTGNPQDDLYNNNINNNNNNNNNNNKENMYINRCCNFGKQM